jgi:heavy metal translocating P-type ATPase
MSICSHCRGPITGAGHTGRPGPGTSAATYCCFGCLSLGEQHRQEPCAGACQTRWKLDGLGVRLGIGILVVGQSTIFGLALNLHNDVPDPIRWFAQTLILCSTLLVIALLGGPLVRAAWHELRRGRLTIEALFLLTLCGAMAASLQAYVTARGKIYFEVVSVLLVVYVLGKVIGARARANAIAGASAWAARLSVCRHVDETGRTRTVLVSEICPGDVIEVYPGEIVAVDGVIREGRGCMTEAPVSGEPFAVVRRPGDRILAGVASHDATFRIEATARGNERQIDRLLAAVEEARDRPLSLQRQADRLGRVLLPLVVLGALGTFAYWAILTDAGWDVALFNAMSVLLVACPCVIGLATPVVIWSAVGRLAERGLVVRTGDAVERLAEVDLVLLDKTGTLTEDRPALLEVATVATGAERARVLGWVSLVEEHSRHPIARPFADLPRPFAPSEEPGVTAFRAVPGCGVTAELVEANGVQHRIAIGEPDWIVSVSREPKVYGLAPHPQSRGRRIDVAIDGERAAVAIVAERLRGSVPQMLAEFRRLGIPSEVLTGDTAERAGTLDLPRVRAGLLPDDKQAWVEELKRAGRKPLMVGDGINDASALASAHVGIALSSGTDLAVGASAVTLYHDDLRVLPWAVALSRSAIRAVRRNLYRAGAYNLIGMTLAACGVLHPVVAVLLMMVSSVSLIFSSTRVGVVSCEPVVCTPGYRWGRPRSLLAGRADSSDAPLCGFRAVVHAAAVAAQAVGVLLLEPTRHLPAAVLLLGAFAGFGVTLAWLWHRWGSIPHVLDMAFGMLTLGNLGMLLGWWADNDFSPVACPVCCSTGSLLSRPWMWVGMLAFANGAMVWLGRRPLPRGTGHVLAMFTGGNVGMVLGMVAGGWCAAQIETSHITLAVAAHFTGMTLGMLVGMLLGTWLTERLIASARLVRGSGVLVDEVVSREAEPDDDHRVPDVVGR